MFMFGFPVTDEHIKVSSWAKPRLCGLFGDYNPFLLHSVWLGQAMHVVHLKWVMGRLVSKVGSYRSASPESLPSQNKRLEFLGLFTFFSFYFSYAIN